MNTTFIYALVDPRTEGVCYVGKSNTPEDRLYRHIKRPAYGKMRPWIQELASINQKPILVILESCNMDEWEEREIWWMSYFKGNGVILFNARPGGGGHSEIPNEIKAKLSATHKENWQNPEYREKMLKIFEETRSTESYKQNALEARVKLWKDPKHREKMLRVHNTPEAIAKRVAKLKEAHNTPETRAKMQAIRDSPGYRENLSAKLKEILATPEAKEKRSKTSKANLDVPGLKEALIAHLDTIRTDPEIIAKKKDAQNTPEYLEHQSNHKKQMWADPEKRARLIESMKKRSTPEYLAKQSASQKAAHERKMDAKLAAMTV